LLSVPISPRFRDNVAHAMHELSILFVASRFPLPLRSGDRARAFHQVRLLGRRHRVTLVAYADPNQAERARSLLESERVSIVTVPFSRRAALTQVARHAWSDVPLQVALFDSPQMRATIRSLVETRRFDLAHVQLARMAPLVDASLGLPRVVDLIDALSANMRSRAEHDSGPLRWAARIDAPRMAVYERRICEEVEAALVVAPAERHAIGSPPSLTVNSNGVDLSEFPRATGPRDPRQVVFTGNLGYFANVDALCWFADRVLPLIWREMPDVRLKLAGARPTRRVLALGAHDSRITVAGDVDDMHPVLTSAQVAVAPMNAGSGQLLKVLEAMSTATPVVATSRALSGIDAIDGRHAVVGDTPEAFAKAVVSLLADRRRAEEIGAAGRELVERLYTWERSVAELERVYETVLNRARTDAVGCT
jgi:sugar transferase (PEP-CTERM/EpsH1 system associated)